MNYFTKYLVSDGKLLKDVTFSVEQGKFISLSSNRADDTISFGNSIVLPGFVNTHTHSVQSLMRGLGDDTDLLEWLREKVYRCCDRMDEKDVYTAALLSFTEMVENGITAVVDFFYLNRGSNDCAEAVIRAAQDVGIRLVLARTMMDWEDAPISIRETTAKAERNFINLFDAHQSDTEWSRICPAPHSAYGASEDMIRLAGGLSETYQIPCHMHVSDSRSAMELTYKLTGMDYVQYLHNVGVLNNRFVAVHCIHCDDDAVRRLVSANTMISHNPVSNMFLGEPPAPIVSLLKNGAIVGLGTDGAASNNRLSIIQEMKVAALHQKSATGDPQGITSSQVYHMATQAGGAITGFPIGDIRVGYNADFVVVGLDETSLIPEFSLLSHLVYALTEKAITAVYVNGRKVMSKGRALRIDYERLYTNANLVASSWI